MDENKDKPTQKRLLDKLAGWYGWFFAEGEREDESDRRAYKQIEESIAEHFKPDKENGHAINIQRMWQRVDYCCSSFKTASIGHSDVHYDHVERTDGIFNYDDVNYQWSLKKIGLYVDYCPFCGEKLWSGKDYEIKKKARQVNNVPPADEIFAEVLDDIAGK